MAIMKGKLLGHLVAVTPRVLRKGQVFPIINQDQIALTAFFVIEIFTPISQMVDELTVSVDIRMEMAKLTDQSTFGFFIAGVEQANFFVKKFIEEERRAFCPVFGWNSRIESTPSFSLFARDNCPADFFGILQYPGLDCFVFAWLHGFDL